MGKINDYILTYCSCVLVKLKDMKPSLWALNGLQLLKISLCPRFVNNLNVAAQVCLSFEALRCLKKAILTKVKLWYLWDVITLSKKVKPKIYLCENQSGESSSTETNFTLVSKHMEVNLLIFKHLKAAEQTEYPCLLCCPWQSIIKYVTIAQQRQNRETTATGYINNVGIELRK